MHDYVLRDDLTQDFAYRGEGNSSIVLALKDQAKVIRLLKKDGKIMKSSQDHHVTQHPMRSIKFIHLIMRPLVSPYLRGNVELVHLKSTLVNRLSRLVEAHRPAHRLDKVLALDDQYALIMDDLCTLPPDLTSKLHSQDALCGPILSVELKPKQGFLPLHRLFMHLSDNKAQQINALGQSCLYGSAQYLKLARGRISDISLYCPINLFSGCPVRMRNALEELLKNPQNNLRVFKNLVLAYGESCPAKISNELEDFFHGIDHESINPVAQKNSLTNEDRFIDLLIQCLLDDHLDKDVGCNQHKIDNENSFNIPVTCLQHQSKTTKCKRCCTFPAQKKHKLDSASSTHQLPASCVLANVLKAQKLDSIGAHRAWGMLSWLVEHSEQKKSSSSDRHKTMDVLEELSAPRIPSGFGSSHQLPNESKEQFYFRKVWEFLVSLTAKDCSIIVTMRRIEPSHYDTIGRCSKMSIRKHILREQRTGQLYFFNVGIADLDQKMPLKISRICDNLNLMLKVRGL